MERVQSGRDCRARPDRDLPTDDQQAVAGDVIDLNFNYSSLPEQADLLRQALRDVAGSGDIDALLRYQPHAGRPQDRAGIAAQLSRRGIPTTAERVLIVGGAQHGLAVTMMARLNPGDVVAVPAKEFPSGRPGGYSKSFAAVITVCTMP
jgi:DNA-binding transcriptional MocR family regulator